MTQHSNVTDVKKPHQPKRTRDEVESGPNSSSLLTERYIYSVLAMESDSVEGRATLFGDAQDSQRHTVVERLEQTQGNQFLSRAVQSRQLLQREEVETTELTGHSLYVKANPERAIKEGGEYASREVGARIAALKDLSDGFLIFVEVLRAPSAAEVDPANAKNLFDFIVERVVNLAEGYLLKKALNIIQKVPIVGAVAGVTQELLNVKEAFEEYEKKLAEKRDLKTLSDFFVENFTKLRNIVNDEDPIKNESRDKVEWIITQLINAQRYKDAGDLLLDLEMAADESVARAKAMNLQTAFLEIAGTWIEVTTTPSEVFSIPESAHIEIRFDRELRVTKAFIHASGGNKIAEQFNTTLGGVNPLDVRCQKVIWWEGQYLKSRTPGGGQIPANIRLDARNELQLRWKEEEPSISEYIYESVMSAMQPTRTWEGQK